MRSSALVCALVSLLFSPARADSSPLPAREVPNVVWIVADDLGWSDVGYAGHTDLSTPHLDSLAARSVVFRHAYSNGPNCAPSRASMMSGLLPPAHRVYTVGTAARGKATERRLVPVENITELDPAQPTAAELLGELGFVAGHFGKWHLGGTESTNPLARGFSVNVGGNAAGHPKRYFAPYANPDLEDGPDGESLTERMCDEACRFIERNRDRPFFVHLSHYAVHTPLQARPERIAYFREHLGASEKRATYAAMVESLDASVGRIVATLEQLELLERTLLLFVSDNGGLGSVTTKEPLRGSKGMLYEGGIRVPLLVRWTGRFAPAVVDEPVQGTDLLPTLLEVCGVELRSANRSEDDAPPHMDGVSLLSLLSGDAASLPPRDLHWHFPAYLEGRDQRGARDPKFRQRPAAAIRRGQYKGIEFFEDGAFELYDLARDPGEQNDLSKARPDLAAELRDALHRWQEASGAFVPSEREPRFDGD